MPVTPEQLRVFIGFDSKEPVTFAVAMSSLMRHTSRPTSVTPLVQPTLRGCGLYSRPRQPNEATEFSLTRFLVPHLSGYDGYSLFLDSDVVVRADILSLLMYPLAYPSKAVFCCQHDYVPKDLVKFDGHEQTRYPKKNWSSVMLFNNANCAALTPAYVSAASGADLHRFQWCDDHRVGDLPLAWNWLVGEYQPNPNAHILHYTCGAPCFDGYQDCDHADIWWEEYAAMMKPARAVEAALAMSQVR